MSIEICPNCKTHNRSKSKTCIRCNHKFKRPIPVFWFMYLALLFVTYATLDFYHLV